MRTAKQKERDPSNKFRVPLKTWGSWTLIGRHVFNKTFQSAMKSQDMFDAYSGKLQKVDIPDHQWRTLAWNFAFIAASVTSRGERHLIKDLDERIRG